MKFSVRFREADVADVYLREFGSRPSPEEKRELVRAHGAAKLATCGIFVMEVGQSVSQSVGRVVSRSVSRADSQLVS